MFLCATDMEPAMVLVQNKLKNYFQYHSLLNDTVAQNL